MKRAFIILSVLALACSTQQKEGKKASTDEPTTVLKAQLQEADSLLNSAPFDELLALREEVDDLYWWFYEEFKDTSDRDFWVYELSDLQRVHKGISNAEKEPSMLKESIEFSLQQLSDLKLAYESGELDSASFYTYLMDEQAATEAVSRRSLYRSNETQVCLDTWKELRPILDSTRSYYISTAE